MDAKRQMSLWEHDDTFDHQVLAIVGNNTRRRVSCSCGWWSSWCVDDRGALRAWRRHLAQLPNVQRACEAVRVTGRWAHE